MSRRKNPSVITLAILLALTAAPKLSAASFKTATVLAQTSASTPAFPLPSAVPSGTTVRIDGSDSMAVINQSLKQRFEQQYSGTSVELGTGGTDAALKAVLDGKVDLAAIGRPLSDTETAQGLVQAPISREKIAIVVGANNPYKGELSFEQFARIFRGEITDWAQVGGAPGRIRFIDRPATSDTRQALSYYKVFRTAPFATGATATPVTQDSTAAVISELGNDGISYAIAGQVLNQNNVRVLSMHGTLPDDPRYPYSQPRGYVYKQNPSPAVQAFLGFAAAPAGQEAVSAARATEAAAAGGSASPVAEASASPEATVSPEAAASSGSSPETAASPSSASPSPATESSSQGIGWLPWLLLPLLGLLGLLLWRLKGRQSGSVDTPPPAPANIPDPPASPGSTLAERAGTVISADRSSIVGDRPEVVPPPSVGVPEPAANSPRGAIPGAAIATGGAAMVGAAALAGLGATPRPESRIVLTPQSSGQAYAYWETPEAHKAELRQQGGQKLALRICDVTDLASTDQTSQNCQQFDCDEADQDRHVPIPAGDRDYTAEIGYLTEDNRWLLLAKSSPIYIAAPAVAAPAETLAGDVAPPEITLPDTTIPDTTIPDTTPTPAIPGAAIAAGAAALAGAAGLGMLSAKQAHRDSRIVLTPQDARQAYAYWETPEDHKAELRQQGGKKLALRLYDVTDLGTEHTTPDRYQQFDCDEADQDRHIPIPAGDRDYTAEIGYLTEDNRWLLLARSAPVQIAAPALEVPTAEPVMEEAFATPEEAILESVEPSIANGVVPEVAEPEALEENITTAEGQLESAITPDPPVEDGVSSMSLLETSTEAVGAPEVVPPEVAAPEVLIPEVLAPEVITPEVPASEVATPEVTTSEAAAPEVPIPETPAEDAAIAIPGGGVLAGGAAALAGAAAMFTAPVIRDEDPQSVVEAAKFDVGQTDLTAEALAAVDADLPDLPDGYGDSRIVLLPRDPQWAYTYWDVPNNHREELRRQGGQRLALRVYDVTDVDLNYQSPHSIQQYECDELARDWYIPVPLSDRDYLVEIGYVANDGGWLVLARSLPIRIPPTYPSDWFEEQFVTIPWEENLQGKIFLMLIPPGKKLTYGNPIYDRIFGMTQTAEAQRFAGLDFGSMQQVPEQTISSFALSSGVGMVALPTESGAGLSGIGMAAVTLSGIGLSGVGLGILPTESGVGLAGLTTSGVGMSGVGLMGLTTSGIGLSGLGLGAVPTQSGVGMSGVGMVGLTSSGIGMMSGAGLMGLTLSGIGMSGVGLAGLTTSGMGISGYGLAGLTTSGMGMSGIGMMGLTSSGIGMMSGAGLMGLTLSGIGMSGYGLAGLTTSGMGMSGIGMSGIGMMSGVGFSASMPPIRPRKFWLVADAELIVYGATEPDATVTIAGRNVKLNPDGTFRFQMSFQDGLIDYPILAVAVDGEQTRSIHMKFVRETPARRTNTKDEASDEWLP